MFSFEGQSPQLTEAMDKACEMADRNRDEFLTPEHLLWGIAWQNPFILAIGGVEITHNLIDYLKEYSVTVPENIEYHGAEPSRQLIQIFTMAYGYLDASGAKEIDVPHIIKAILELERSYAKDALIAFSNENTAELISQLIENYDQTDKPIADEDDTYPYDEEEEEEELFTDPNEWKKFVVCLNDYIASHNPLIGREHELDRTIQVLCRKDKNNPLHVGEPGVGKTAIAYGLAALIESGQVPERLKGSKVYSLDLAAIMAGTQYRGSMEANLQKLLKGLKKQGNVILYIDEIHNIIGAGRVEGGSLDIANILKPYLEAGTIRFFGSTTYDEYNRNFVRSKGFGRRFEKIDIAEPTIEQCMDILMGLKPKYEEYHRVEYTDDAIAYAVTGAEKYITGRFLPDKAIDLIDEAGAWHETHRNGDATPVIDKKDIASVLAKICNVETLAEDNDDMSKLENLESRILSQIYGQDKAVQQVVEAVQLASAGLIDDNKPMASLLFVGPTGVGKTEVAKVLAKELSLPLVRFDMSEYAEKHTVAKLIGSPAGYVGYDDGGLLTDAIRKTPHCVLLFDELEKAHQDIYNILLQVMDYAVLTDNKGQKADFRHVVFIMTTNAGAQYARHDHIGFAKSGGAGEVMMKSVKKTFKPEFLNRLTDITIFHDMTREMAQLILEKKLGQLRQKLSQKNVEMVISDEAMEYLLKNGFSEEYGGREIDRVITTELKPLLMRAMLFGPLKNGGKADIVVKEGKLAWL